jgi:hypothetical protein
MPHSGEALCQVTEVTHAVLIRRRRPMDSIHAMLIPPDPDDPVCIFRVVNSAAALSEAMGGALLDDSVVGRLAGGSCYTMYLADELEPTGDPNPRAVALAKALGHFDRQLLGRMNGLVLVTGLNPCCGDDVDVPEEMFEVALRAGIQFSEPDALPPSRHPL